MLVTNNPGSYGLQGIITTSLKDVAYGQGMKFNDEGTYLAAGSPFANDGAGEIVIVNTANKFDAKVLKRFKLPEWKTGGSPGVYSRAGQLVSGSKDLSVIATNTQANGFDKGAIYVMDMDSNFTVIGSSRLLPSEILPSDYFGTYHDMNDRGDRMVVGAFGYNATAGRVYVYIKSGGVWQVESVLESQPGDGVVRFGQGVSMSGSGDIIAVGGGPSADGTGKVYVYKRRGWANWTLMATITDHHNVTTAGRFQPVLSKDGKKLFVAYSMSSASATESSGIDIYNIDVGAETLVRTDNVETGVIGGSWLTVMSASSQGEAFLGCDSKVIGNQYNGVFCVQKNPETGKYEKSWTYSTEAQFGTSPHYPAVNGMATIWASSVSLYYNFTMDSFFIGR